MNKVPVRFVRMVNKYDGIRSIYIYYAKDKKVHINPGNEYWGWMLIKNRR